LASFIRRSDSWRKTPPPVMKIFVKGPGDVTGIHLREREEREESILTT
jgi:hypothetical protein